MVRIFVFGILGLLVAITTSSAAPPVAVYVYPAGGQKGTTVPVRVGGLFIHQTCQFNFDSKGVTPAQTLRRGPAIWFEGPVVPLPESQQQEDYPADLLGSVAIAPTAELGPKKGRISTSEGAATGLVFVVGELPEVVETEIDGEPIPVTVTLPATANGRIFPREDVDLWAFSAKKGQSVSVLAVASAINSPLAPKLEITDANGRVLAEDDVRPVPGTDASARFIAPADGVYHARISDPRGKGGPSYVYRLTITSGPVIDRVFPLGGRRGQTVPVRLTGQAVPTEPVPVKMPTDSNDDLPSSIRIGSELSNPVVFDVDDVPEFGSAIPQTAVLPPAIFNGIVDTSPTAWPVQLMKNTNYEFALKARKLGSPLCGVIAINDAQGVEVARSDVSLDANADPVVKYRPTTDGVFTLRVSERFRGRGGPAFAYRLKVSMGDTTNPGFKLSFPVDVANVPRGGNVSVKVKATRTGGFNGPISLTLDDLPAGVTATPTTIPQGQSEATIKLTAESLAKVISNRVAVTGSASIRTSIFQKKTLQDRESMIVAVAVPVPFKVTGEYTMTAAPRGQVYRRNYSIDRGTYNGPLEIRLAEKQARHLQGVTAPTVIVPSGKNEFVFTAHMPPWMELGRTCRICVMAVGIVKDPDGTEHPVTFSSVDQNQQMIVVAEPGRLDLELGNPVTSFTPGTTLKVPFRVARVKGLTGPVKVELVVPSHWKGITTKPVTVMGDEGELTVVFAKDAGPFNMPATIRATLMDRGDPVIGEAKLELVSPR